MKIECLTAVMERDCKLEKIGLTYYNDLCSDMLWIKDEKMPVTDRIKWETLGQVLYYYEN